VGVRKHNQYQHTSAGPRNDKKDIGIHRLVWLCYYGDISDLQINHKNGIKSDNKIKNLELMTNSENVIHSFEVLGRKANPPKHEKTWNTKFTWEDINKIRYMHDIEGYTNKEISDIYDVGEGCIHSIVLNVNWRDENYIPIKTIRGGETKGVSKLTWVQVNEIRSLRSEGHSAKELSVLYKTTDSNIYNIVNYLSWKVENN
jgi:hypothetical protein